MGQRRAKIVGSGIMFGVALAVFLTGLLFLSISYMRPYALSKNIGAVFFLVLTAEAAYIAFDTIKFIRRS